MAYSQMAKRIDATGMTWIESVALWSAEVRTDEKGRAVVSFEMPEFNGNLRIIAVAATDKAVGAKSGNILVRRPYLMQTSMPRFLLPGDRADCRVVLYNRSDAPCRAEVRWSSGGTLIEAEGSRTFELAANGEADAFATFDAAPEIGQGEIQWEAIFLDSDGNEIERLTETAPIPVRAPAAFETHPRDWRW